MNLLKNCSTFFNFLNVFPNYLWTFFKFPILVLIFMNFFSSLINCFSYLSTFLQIWCTYFLINLFPNRMMFFQIDELFFRYSWNFSFVNFFENSEHFWIHDSFLDFCVFYYFYFLCKDQWLTFIFKSHQSNWLKICPPFFIFSIS